MADLYRLLPGGTLKEHTDGVTCLAFSSNGRWLATGSTDKTVQIYEVDTDSKRVTKRKSISFAHQTRGGVNTLCWPPLTFTNGNLLLIGLDDGSLNIYDVDQQQDLRAPLVHKSGDNAHSAPCMSVAWGERHLASSSYSGEVILYTVDPNNHRNIAIKWRKEVHSDPCTGVGFVKTITGAQILVTAGIDGFLFFLDLETGKTVRQPYLFPSDRPEQAGMPVPLAGLQVAPSNKHVLVSTMNGQLKLWAVDSNKVVRTFNKAGNTERLLVPSMATPDRKSQYIIFGGEEGGRGKISIWPVVNSKDDPAAITPATSRDAHQATVFCCASSTNTRTKVALLATGSSAPENAVKVWEYIGPREAA